MSRNLYIALSVSLLLFQLLPSELASAHDEGHWPSTQRQWDKVAEAEVALKLLRVDPDVADFVAERLFYVRYHFETGQRLSKDPVLWASQLPKCMLFGNRNEDCRFFYDAHDGHELSRQEQTWCSNVGGGDAWDCGAAGESPDVNPEARRSAQAKAKSRCQAIAVRLGRDPGAC